VPDANSGLPAASPPIPAQAFTDFGVESLVELIKIHRESTPTRER
jgi:hypothetical protein